MAVTLRELHDDPQKMLTWLRHDGNPPVVVTWDGRGVTEVDTAEKVELWWHHHLEQVKCPLKRQSYKRFLLECASFLGFKGKGRLAAARAALDQTEEVQC